MRVQDSVLLTSAMIWSLSRRSTFAWMQTDAPGLTNIVALDAASIPCSSSLHRPYTIAYTQTGRCS